MARTAKTSSFRVYGFRGQLFRMDLNVLNEHGKRYSEIQVEIICTISAFEIGRI